MAERPASDLGERQRLCCVGGRIVSVGAIRIAVFAALCSLLTACNSGSSQSSNNSPSPATPVGATAPAPAATSSAIAESPTGVQTTSPPAVAPGTDKMLVYPAGKMVYLPTTGWLTEDQFWDVYFNHSDKLTVDLDFPALTAMGYQRPVNAPGG